MCVFPIVRRIRTRATHIVPSNSLAKRVRHSTFNIYTRPGSTSPFACSFQFNHRHNKMHHLSASIRNTRHAAATDNDTRDMRAIQSVQCIDVKYVQTHTHKIGSASAHKSRSMFDASARLSNALLGINIIIIARLFVRCHHHIVFVVIVVDVVHIHMSAAGSQ